MSSYDGSFNFYFIYNVILCSSSDLLCFSCFEYTAGLFISMDYRSFDVCVCDLFLLSPQNLCVMRMCP